jgi:transposase
MSRHPQATYPIPEDTQRVARAAFPRGNIYMQVADHLGTIYHDAQFAALFPTRGQPAEAPARLALATVLQCAEGLSDRQAADAIRSRMDWKYVLGLDLTDPGFHHTVLSEFRTRLVAGEAASLLLEALLTLARAQGLLKTHGRHKCDGGLYAPLSHITPPGTVGGPGRALRSRDSISVQGIMSNCRSLVIVYITSQKTNFAIVLHA